MFMMVMYILILILSLNITYWWWFWIALEVLNWLLVLSINNMGLMLLFLSWQSMSTISVMFCVILMSPYNLMLLMVLIFKMSFPPFHYWYWMILSLWKWKNFMIFTHIHKYPAMLLMLNYINMLLWNFFMIIPLLVFLFMWFFMNMKSIIFSFLLMESIWIVFSWFTSFKLLHLYMLLTFFLMSNFIYLNKKKVKSMWNKFELNIYLLLLFSLPPLITFMFKWIICSYLNILNMYFFLMILLLSVYFYWNVFYLNFMFNSFYNIKLLKKVLYSYLVVNMMYLYL